MTGVVNAQSNPPSWLGRHLAGILLDVTGAGLVLGGVLHVAGAATAGNTIWVVCGAIGAAYSLWTMAESLRRGRVGVDLIALLASVGALAVGEYLAAAVISVMMASGRALEGWAAGRANRDLRRLLERAPTTAHRYEGEELRTLAADGVEPGDRVLVQSGELVPTDGLLLTSAVLDESALTGEALPVTREPGEPVRSGVVNAGSPFDLRVTARASESAYAGIVRLVRAGGVLAGSVRAAGRPLRDLVPRLELGRGGRRVDRRRPGAGRCRPRRGHAVPAHPRRAGCPGRGTVTRGEARSRDQGRRRARTFGRVHDTAHRQDGDPDDGPSVAHHHRAIGHVDPRRRTSHGGIPRPGLAARTRPFGGRSGPRAQM